MVLELLKQVHVNGAHLVKRGSSASAKAWNKVNTQLFMEPCMVLHQSCYEPGDVRKLRDKFDSTIEMVTAEKESGIYYHHLTDL